MKIINQIDIKYFRSFAEKTAERIEYIGDLNIFSGGNDSGKSNILRAINLFFNGRIGPGLDFNFERDFSKFQLENSIKIYQEKKERNPDQSSKKKDQFIEIKIHFDLTEYPYGSFLPKKFWISKRWTRTKNGELNNNIETLFRKQNAEYLDSIKDKKLDYSNVFKNLKKSTTTFLNKIDFYYVPAIKDSFFFKELYALLQERLNQESSSRIEESKQELQNIIKEETENFFGKFKTSTGLNAGFLIEDELLDFRRNLEVDTGRNILLTSRGDGIQARLIPDILDELSDRNRYVIWGFEEPENSYEYKKAKELADQFNTKYSKNQQIFITTHSKEFLGIKPVDNNVSIYRVFKNIEGYSKIERYDELKGFQKENIKNSFLSGNSESTLNTQEIDALKLIYDDLGIVDEARVISELENQINILNLEKNELEELQKKASECLEDQEKLLLENRTLKEKIDSIPSSKIVVFCENKNAELLNALGYENIEFIGSADKNYAYDTSKAPGRSAFALLDKDFITDEEKEFLERTTNVRLLNYYCLENYFYHPLNLKEYFDSKGIPFDIIDYTTKITEEFGIKRTEVIMKIESGRQSHKKIKEHTQSVYNSSQYSMLSTTTDFEIFYKYFTMKDYCGTIRSTWNLRESELITTGWFKAKIKSHILSMGINL